MKLIQRFYLIIALVSAALLSQAQIKVGDNPTTLNAAAVLEIESVTKGFLLPRMTDTQMNAIASPPAGLMVYNTTNNCTYIFKNSTWTSLCASSPTLTLSNDSLTISGGNTVVLPSSPIQTASNGLGLVGTDVQLGGTLSSATSIVTSSSNTLSLKNLQTGTTSDSLVLVSTGGVLKKRAASTFTDSQTLSISNDSLTISGGNTVVLPSSPIQTASNGLGLVGTDVQLGGTLSSATSIVTSSSNTLSLKNLQTGTTSDSLVLVSTGGVLKKRAASTFTDSQTLSLSNDTLTISSGNNVVLPSAWKLGGNAVTSTQKLGTTSGYPLPIITNNVERVRVDTSGRVGIGTSSPTSTLQVNGSVAMNIVSKSANYTLTSSDYTVLCDASSAGFTLTLPAASSCTGRIYRIIKIDETTNLLTFSTALRYSKNTSITTLNYNKTLTIQSDGTDWWIVAQY